MRLCFDRGTLLLRDVAPALDPAGLPGVVWDARVRELRAPACSYRELHAALRSRGFDFADEVPAGWPPPAPWAEVHLRSYQEDAVAAWERAGRRGVVVLPTGAGKTRVALAAMARSRSRALCLAPTRALVEQWTEVIGQSYPGPVGRFADGVRQLRPITVATYEGALRSMDHLGGSFDLVVLDEAHHLGGMARPELLEMASARNRLGLTATPVRETGAMAMAARLLGEVVFEKALHELVDSALAPFDLMTVHLDLGHEERAAYETERSLYRPVLAALRSQTEEGSWSEIVRLSALTIEGRAAMQAWRRARSRLAGSRTRIAAVGELLERHRDARTLVFTPDNATACAIAREHLIMPITCDVGRQERERALARFRSGELRALVSTRVLNEGLDVPDADVGIVVGGGAGERAYSQRLGRLLRPAPGKRAVVYELVLRGTPEVAELQRRREGFATRAAGPP